MSAKNPGSIFFLSVSGVFFIFSGLTVLCSSCTMLFLPASTSLCVYAIPEVYQKLQKYSSREEKGTFACLPAVFLSVCLRWLEAFDVLVIC